MPRPAVVFGGPSPEHDISILTGLQALRVLAEGGGDVVALYWSKTGDWFQVDRALEAKAYLEGVPRGAQKVEFVSGLHDGGFFATGGALRRRRPIEFDVAVNCCHGGPGEDGHLQSLFDLSGVRYTGPTARGAALGMDKLAFGGVVEAAGLPTLPRVAVTTELAAVAFPAPWIVKPRFGGSSIGIEIVDDLETAQALTRSSVHLREGAVLEPFLPDAVDLNVAVRSWPKPELSAIERPTRSGGGFYSYDDKYSGGSGFASAPRELPAALPDEIETRVRETALAVAELTLVRGAARVDFLWRGEDLWVNESNTVPGSLGLYLWRASGVTNAQLLSDLIAEAGAAPAGQFSTAGADGRALAGADNIAGKLA